MWRVLSFALCGCIIMKDVFHAWSVPVGMWGVGLATPTVQVDTVPLGGDSNSWVLTSEGTCLHNGQVVSRVGQGQLATEGDIIVSYRWMYMYYVIMSVYIIYM